MYKYIDVFVVVVWSPNHIQLFCDPMTVACQAPLSMEFSRQEYWSGLPCPPPGDLLNPRIEPRSPALQADSLLSELPGKPIFIYMWTYIYMCVCVCVCVCVYKYTCERICTTMLTMVILGWDCVCLFVCLFLVCIS